MSWCRSSCEQTGGVAKVVLVPGFTQTAASWRDVETIVAASCDVVAVDVPKRVSFPVTSDAIGIAGKRAVYAGYSMGGRLCLRLALDHPELVKALVLVSASPGLTDPDARRERVTADEALAQMVERDGVDVFLRYW